jgi:hypothetical protein
MNWIKSIFSRKPPKPATDEETAKLDAAYETGRGWSEEMCNVLNLFMAHRFSGLKDRYIAVLQDGLNSAQSNTDYSPIIAMRVEYQLFRENVETLKSKMTAEINEHMAEWINLSVAMEMESLVDELIEQTVKNTTQDILFAGLAAVLDRGEELKDADDAWRIANPELAAEQPLDEKEE